MRRITLGVSSVVFATVSALSNTAIAQIPTGVEITGYTYAGSGCPQGTSVSAQISAPKTGGLPDTLTLVFDKFDKYVARQGAGIPLTERRKNCTITINLKVPQGFSFGLSKVQYAGSANLPAGVRGVQRITYSFPFANSATVETVLNGPYRNNYQPNQVGTAVWSPCGGGVPLNLETSVFLQGDRKPNASISSRQINGKVAQRYTLQWRKCSV